jgi:hypothetical protein
MKTVQFKDGIATDLQVIDSSAHAKSTKAESMGEYYCVCIVCYKNPEISLGDCIVKPTFKKGIVDGTGNLGKHMKSKHIDLWNEASKNVSYVYQGTPMSASRSDSVSDLQTGPTIKTPSPPKSLVYKQAKHKGDQYVLNKFHNLILQFGINNDIPELVLTDHANCPQFKKMIMYAIEHASQLGGNKDLLPGRYKFQSLRKAKFESLVAAISWRVSVTRHHWAENIDHSILFIISYVKTSGNPRRRKYWGLPSCS